MFYLFIYYKSVLIGQESTSRNMGQGPTAIINLIGGKIYGVHIPP